MPRFFRMECREPAELIQRPADIARVEPRPASRIEADDDRVCVRESCDSLACLVELRDGEAERLREIVWIRVDAFLHRRRGVLFFRVVLHRLAVRFLVGCCSVPSIGGLFAPGRLENLSDDRLPFIREKESPSLVNYSCR